MSTVADAVYQKSNSTGTGNFELISATGFRTFAGAFPGSSATAKFFYHIRNKTTGAYESGLGYLNGSGELVRARVLASSNSNALVDFAAGQKVVINDVAAAIQEKFFNLVSSEVTADRSLVFGDELQMIEGNKASTLTLTVPNDTDVNFEIGTQILITQTGAGLVQLAAASGVTILTAETLKIAKRYAVMSLRKRAANSWHLFGNLEAAP